MRLQEYGVGIFSDFPTKSALKKGIKKAVYYRQPGGGEYRDHDHLPKSSFYRWRSWMPSSAAVGTQNVYIGSSDSFSFFQLTRAALYLKDP